MSSEQCRQRAARLWGRVANAADLATRRRLMDQAIHLQNLRIVARHQASARQ
jgi:hypothetical protein